MSILHTFWLDVKFEHNNKALRLYFIPPFEQFTTVFWWIPVGLLAHVTGIWYIFFLLLLHSLEQFFKNDIDHWRSDHSPLNIISATTKWSWPLKKWLPSLEKVSQPLHKWSWLWRIVHSNLNVIWATTNVILAIEEVITTTLKVISAATKVTRPLKEWSERVKKLSQPLQKWFWALQKWSQPLWKLSKPL